MFNVEVDDTRDEVFAHDHTAHVLPLHVTLAQHAADRLDRHTHVIGWSHERSNLH